MIASLQSRFSSFWQPIYCFLKECDTFAQNNSTVLFWSLAILYRLALDVLYIWAAHPQYAYAGLVFAPVSWKYLISWGLYLCLFFFLPKQEKETIPILLHIQFVYTVAPMLTFYALANGSSEYMLMIFVCVMLQILLLRRSSQNKKTVRITGIKNYVTVMLGVLVIFSLIIPILYNGFAGLKAFDFTYIYEMRADATYPPGFGYLFSWMQKVIIPFAILYFIDAKLYKWATLAGIIQIIFYMESGEKFTLFVLIPILAIYLLSKTGHLLKLMYMGLIAVFAIVLICYQLDKTAFISSLGIQLNAIVSVRALFHPCDIKFDFYECFQHFPFLYFSEGMIGQMLGLTYPFAGSVGQVICAFAGAEFLSSNSNTGYLGDSYAQMGFVGMLLMSLLLTAILRGIQNYDNKKNFSVLTALFSIFMINLNDGALLTVLLTGGMLLGFMLVFIYFENSQEGDLNGIQRI